MATKKLTVGMISDDLRVTAVNTTKVGPDSNDSGKANWVLTIFGFAYFSYITRVSPYDYETGTRHVPRTKLPKLNYCLQKLCNSQRSEGYKLWGTDDEWEAFVKISATMDQNIDITTTPPPGSVAMEEPPIIEYHGPKKVMIAEEVITGQRCPDLWDVKKALEKVTSLLWWELREDGKVLPVVGVKFNEFMDCEKEPREDMQTGEAAEDQDKTDKVSWVEKGQAAAYDKLEKSISARLFQGFAEGFDVSIKTLTYGLRFLNIISDEINPPEYEAPTNDRLCKCSGSGMTDKCWACRYEAISDSSGAKKWVVKCVQDIPRVGGACPYYLNDKTGNKVKSWETQDECELEKHIYCPSPGDPPTSK